LDNACEPPKIKKKIRADIGRFGGIDDPVGLTATGRFIGTICGALGPCSAVGSARQMAAAP
jgi:hypothetical protein